MDLIKIRLLFSLVFGLGFFQIYAGDFYIDSIRDHDKLNGSLLFLEDQEGLLSFNDVRESSDFIPFTNGSDFDWESTYWGKISFKNELDQEYEGYFFPGYYNYAESFLIKNGEISNHFTGIFDPASKKSSPTMESSAIPLELEPGEAATLFFRVKNINHYPVNFNAHLISQEKWREYTSTSQRNLVQGIFQGILWIMIIYNIFLFFINRDRTYIYYTLYMVGLSIYFLNIRGFLTETIFSEIPKSIWYVSVSVNIASVFYIQFVRKFLNLETLLPVWDRASRYIIMVFVALIIFKLGVLIFTFNIPILNTVMQSVLLIGSIFSLVLVVYLFQTGDKVARYFIAGTFLLVLSMLLSALSYLNQGNFTMNYFNYLQAGVVAEIVLFSLGLGYRMRMMEKEKRQVQDELILQLKKNEKIQKLATSELEQKVLERTALILDKNSELESLNHDLQHLNEEKNHLMSILAHDLRNPLSGAMSVVDMMNADEKEFTEEQREYVGLLKRTLTRMNDMINKILDYRKAEAGKVDLQLEKVNAASLVCQVAASFRQKSSEKNISISLNTEESYASLDREYFIQIIENLISNGIKFSPEDKSLKVNVTSCSQKVRISVIDEGPGLTNEDKQKAFRRFQRLSAQPTNGESTTGLGLSIVKKYTEAMEGRVWVESSPGEGAAFFLEFEEHQNGVSK